MFLPCPSPLLSVLASLLCKNTERILMKFAGRNHYHQLYDYIFGEIGIGTRKQV